jgi:hypothetical protein
LVDAHAAFVVASPSMYKTVSAATKLLLHHLILLRG